MFELITVVLININITSINRTRSRQKKIKNVKKKVKKTKLLHTNLRNDQQLVHSTSPNSYILRRRLLGRQWWRAQFSYLLIEQVREVT